MSQKIQSEMRAVLAQKAAFCCEYCRVKDMDCGSTFHIDHVRPVKHFGLTELSNLAFSCPDCNFFKGTDIGTFIFNRFTRFFNPRRDRWPAHFSLEKDGRIAAKTNIGQATAIMLQFNLPRRLAYRKLLIETGIMHITH